MARFVPLGFRRQVPARRVIAAGFGFIAGCSLSWAATPGPATNASSATPPQHAAAKPIAKSATSPAPLSPALQKSLDRYGDIVTTGTQVSYPLHLHLPLPYEIEVHVPTSEDLVIRAKLEALANLSDDELRKQLAAWPALNKMSLRDQGLLLQRIQDFRDYHVKIAMQKAHGMGMPTLTPAQAAKFEKEYWDERLKIDQDLVEQFQPIYEAREQEMDAALLAEFSSPVPATAPPVPKAMSGGKPSPTTTTSTSGNVATPVAQSPH
jgi:hypothetical protein